MANRAFDAAFPADFVPPLNADHAYIGDYRCSFTSLEYGGEHGVFIDAVPMTDRSREPDPRFLQLPEIIRLAGKSDAGITDVHRFIERLDALRPSLFSRIVLFVSRERQSFVLVRETGEPDSGSRNWARWPLQRLFVNRRACVIRNPVTNVQALAVPFSVAPGQRYVVVAPLRAHPELNATERVFIQCLESLLLPSVERKQTVRAYSLDSIRTEPLAAAPMFLWYGKSESLSARIEGLMERRGWDLWRVANFAEVLKAIEGRTVDAILLDGSVSDDPVSMLRAIRHLSGVMDVPIVLFNGNAVTPEVEALVDRCLPKESEGDTIFRALKEVLRLVPERRSEALRSAALGFSSLLQSSRDCTELARNLALAASELASGSWASVQLFDHAGNMYAAEVPVRIEPLMDRVPFSLLNGYAVMRSRIDSEFFAEVTDDPRTQQRLESLAPLSGASIPIADGGRIVGTMIVLSIVRRMYEPEFDALLQIADVGARAFAEVQTRVLRAQAATNIYEPLWDELTIGDCRIYAYRGPNARTCIRIAALDETHAAITAVTGSDADASFELAEAALQELATVVHHWEDPADAVDATVATFDDGVTSVLAGIVSSQTSRFAYAAARFPGPLQIAMQGPASSLTLQHRRQRGNLPVRARTVTLLCGSGAERLMDSAQIVAAVQDEVRRGAPNPLQSLPKIADDPFEVAFFGITTRSFGAERSNSPDFP